MVVEMNIKSIYLDLIRKKIKKHEYRLNKTKYRSLKVGDEIKLISNYDSNDFELTKIKKIEVFSTRKEALINYWKDDFKGAFNDFEILIKEVETFYKKDDVKNLGIIVFTIE